VTTDTPVQTASDTIQINVTLPSYWPAAVCTAGGNQIYPQIIPDDVGGAVITWQDLRSGNYDIYARRIIFTGELQWAADGVAICTAASSQQNPQITSDGFGGAVITWRDYRSGNYDIYARRIDRTGNPQWTANGVAICTADNSQDYPQITSDGSGGAIITWQDKRSGTYSDIFAQRIDSDGNPKWAIGGEVICRAANNQLLPQITSDGSGGAIITWYDYRSGNYDIYAQRITANGEPLWTANGVAICTADNSQLYPQITTDGSGGAVITWQDYRSDNYDIYARRIDSTGKPLWTANGVGICTVPTYYQQNPQITSDGSGGAVITWEDYRSGNQDIYARRITANGEPLWTANGVAICTEASHQDNPQITTDGSGGAVITWVDPRSGNLDIYARRINSTGGLLWTADGVAICTEAGVQRYPQIISEGSGGAIITWYDRRSGSHYDIYAQGITKDGVLK
jgi:hypothetical protein